MNGRRRIPERRSEPQNCLRRPAEPGSERNGAGRRSVSHPVHAQGVGNSRRSRLVVAVGVELRWSRQPYRGPNRDEGECIVARSALPCATAAPNGTATCARPTRGRNPGGEQICRRREVGRPDEVLLVVGQVPGKQATPSGRIQSRPSATSTSEPPQGPGHRGDVALEAVEAVLRGDHFVPLREERADHLVEAGTVGPDAVGEHDAWLALKLTGVALLSESGPRRSRSPGEPRASVCLSRRWDITRSIDCADVVATATSPTRRETARGHQQAQESDDRVMPMARLQRDTDPKAACMT
jgi:hypothetical protein